MEEQPRHPKRKKDSKKFTDYFPIFKRAPKLFWVPGGTEAEIVSKDKQNQYAFFEADFKLLETHLMGKFRDLDDEALLRQNQFRRSQVILILGSAVVTILGAVQVSHVGGIWPGLIEAVIAIVLATVAQSARTSKAQDRYFKSRLKAETLRSEYFDFLSRADPYREDQPRVQHLKQRVLRVETSNDRLTPSDNGALSDAEQQAKNAMSEEDQQFWTFYHDHRFLDQLNFYQDRQKEFEKAQTQATNFHSVLMALAGIVSVIGTAHLLNDAFSTFFAILAVAFPVLAAAVTTYANLYAFERIGKLYGDAAEGLRFVDAYFAPGVSVGATLGSYVERIEAIFTSEQKQWGQLVSEIEGASPPDAPPT